MVKQWSKDELPSGMWNRTLNTGSEINAEIEAQLTNTNDLDNATMTGNISVSDFLNFNHGPSKARSSRLNSYITCCLCVNQVKSSKVCQVDRKLRMSVDIRKLRTVNFRA